MSSFFYLRARLLPLVSCLGLLAACSTDKTSVADTLVSNNFESFAGWLGSTPTPSLTKEKAHSGHYSIKVDGNIEYSMSFASSLGALHDVRVKRIKVAGWIFVPNVRAGALLVTQANDAVPNTKPLVWKGLDVVKAAAGKYNQWVEVSEVIELPDAVTASTNISIYLWRNSGNQPVYLDDLTVTAEPSA